MKMIVGLGNPGKEYENTRHNMGFMVLDYFVDGFTTSKKFQAMIKKEVVGKEDVLFVKPLTFMNLSGISVQKIAHYYQILPDDIMVIQDDLDLSFGKIRIKANSSAGGHNGIKSIIECLQTSSFPRLKIGIKHDKIENTISYVLGKFSKDDLSYLQNHYSFYQEIITSFITNGLLYTMNHYHN